MMIRRWGRRLLGVGLAVAVGFVMGMFWIDLGPDLKGVAEREATKYLERPFHIGTVRALVGRGQFEFTDVVIESTKPDEVPFFAAKSIRVSVPWWTIFRHALVVDSVHISGMRAAIESFPNDVNNLPPGLRKSRPDNPNPRWPFTTTWSEIITDNSEFSYFDHDTNWHIVCRNLSVIVVRAMGSYYGKAKFNEGTLSIQSYLPMTAAFDAGFKVEDGMMKIHRGVLTTDGMTTDLAGTADFRHWPEQRYTFKSDLPWSEARRVFFDGSHWDLAGRGQFDGSFHKFKGGYEVNGRVTSPLFSVITSFGTYRFPNMGGTVLWQPKRLELTNLQSEFNGGRTTQSYTLAPLGNPVPPTATWDVQYQNVDLTQLGNELDWPVLRLAGRASGRNFMTWTNGHFGETKTGDGEISSIAPENAALTSPVIPPDLQPVPKDGPWDAKKRLSPYKVSGRVKYTWAPKWMDVADGSWAATPHTYIALKGRTGYGDNSDMPFHLTSTDWQESDRLLVEVMAAFKSTSTPIEVGGFGTFDGVLTKAFWNPHIEGTFDGDHLRYWDVDWGRTKGRAVIENYYADVSNVTFERFGGLITTSGRYSLGYPRKDNGQELDARITIVKWPIKEFRHAFLMDDWPVDGLASAELHLYGGYDRPDGFGSLRFDDAVAWHESFEWATANLRFEYAGVRTDGIELHKSTGIVRGAAFSDWHTSTYSFNFDGQRIPVESLDTWRFPQAPLSGVLQFTANGTGSSLDPTYEAHMSIADLYAGDEGVGQVSSRIHYVKKTVVIDQLEAASPRLSISGSGRVAMNDQLDADLSLRVTNTAIDPYLRLIAPQTKISPYASALVTGAVRVSGELMDSRYLSVDTTIDRVDLRLFDYPLHNDGPLHVTFGDNTVHVGRMRLAGEDTQLDVTGDVSLTDEQVNIRALGGANLAILQAFFPDLRTSGAAEITATVTGDMRAPQFAGSATLSGGRVRHFALPHSVEDLSGRVLFDADGLRLDDVHGKLGGGDVQLGGTIGLKGYLPDELNLTATGRNITLRYPEGFQSRLNADLAVRGTINAAELSGTVNVLHATMTREVDSELGLLGLGAAEAVSSGGVISGTTAETGIPLTYEVQIIAPQTLRIDNALAHIVASGDLTVRGTYDHPSITGRVDINRGEVNFQGNRYVVTRGAVEFTNPAVIEPVFDIEAETRIRLRNGSFSQYGQNYLVTVTVAGPTEHLVPTFSSDPQLPQIDIISLMFGETDPTKLNNAEVNAVTASERANRNLLQASAARLLTSPFSAQVGKVVERTLGVDTVQITPLLGFSDTSQLSPSARVTLGKRVSDRVFVTYTRALNTGRAEVILLEFDQNDRVSWVLSKNEDQSFALDFRVRHRY
jgi:hypothetical protein